MFYALSALLPCFLALPTLPFPHRPLSLSTVSSKCSFSGRMLSFASRLTSSTPAVNPCTVFCLGLWQCLFVYGRSQSRFFLTHGLSPAVQSPRIQTRRYVCNCHLSPPYHNTPSRPPWLLGSGSPPHLLPSYYDPFNCRVVLQVAFALSRLRLVFSSRCSGLASSPSQPFLPPRCLRLSFASTSCSQPFWAAS